MHWNVEQILWAAVLAAHLIVLIVLLGRDRSTRFPWFTAAIAFSSAHLIADHLLHGRLTTVAFYWESYSAVVIESVLAILVLVELALKVFSSGRAGLILKANGWLGWGLVVISIAVAGVWLWGPWPVWAALKADKNQLPLLLVVLAAIKLQLFVAIVTVEAGLLLRIFGKRFGYSWTSHPEQIALGLSTYALGYLTVLATTDVIKRTVHLKSRAEYDHIVNLFARLDNARFALWLIVLLWWIIWLWRDEREGNSTPLAIEDSPVLTGSPSAVVELPEENGGSLG